MSEKQISLTQAEWSVMECLWETNDFLSRVCQRSLSLTATALTQKQALSREELDELYELLKGLEAERHD